ncbi:MAG: hypothetical protein WBO29_02090 [Albidovulum sp.]
MKVGRRHVIVGLGSALTLGGAYRLGSGLRDAVDSIIVRNFGPDIAEADGARQFAEDFVADFNAKFPTFEPTSTGVYGLWSTETALRMRNPESLEILLIHVFVTSTNVARVFPDVADFYYAGLFDPYKNPCANQLSANFLT